MKKQISLLMSFLLILTMIFSLSVQASAIQIKPATVCYDIGNAQSASISYLNGNATIVVDGVSTPGKVASTAPSLQSIVSYDGNTNVLQVKKSSSKTPYLSLTVKEADETTIDNGILKFTSKILITEALDSGKRYFRAIHTGGKSSDNSVKICEGSEFLPNIWYDTVWTIDMESTSKNAHLTFTPNLSAASSAEVASYTISHEYSYARSDISYLRIDMLPSTTSGSVYYADFNITHYPNTTYTKADIVSVGSDGEVAYEQNIIPVKLSEEIPNLSKEHISIQNAGGQDVEISSAAITSDGSNPIVNVITKNPLPAWTQYTLSISADAWGRGSLQIEDGTESDVTAISADFYTPSSSFDMKDPEFKLNGDKLCIDTTFINTTGIPEDITLVVAVYGDDGRIKSVNTKTYAAFEAAYPGEDKSFEVPLTDGDSTKVFVVNGWTNRTPLFGKYWTISYDDIIS